MARPVYEREQSEKTVMTGLMSSSSYELFMCVCVQVFVCV